MLTAENFLKEEDQMKSTFHGRSGSVNVDKNCLSCAGIPAYTMKMFKMACLSYKPSLVDYRNDKMHRNQLLTMRKTLIDKCEEVINGGKWTGKVQNMNTRRLYNDLLQYYGDNKQYLSTGPTGFESTIGSFNPKVTGVTIPSMAGLTSP